MVTPDQGIDPVALARFHADFDHLRAQAESLLRLPFRAVVPSFDTPPSAATLAALASARTPREHPVKTVIVQLAKPPTKAITLAGLERFITNARAAGCGDDTEVRVRVNWKSTIREITATHDDTPDPDA